MSDVKGAPQAEIGWKCPLLSMDKMWCLSIQGKAVINQIQVHSRHIDRRTSTTLTSMMKNEEIWCFRRKVH